jgi:fucose 4-O-acetylase-like acetyltransferase
MHDNQRLGWIDTAKGIGIILVVFAHTLVPSLRDSHMSVKFLWIFIYNFHMPLFLFLSGLLFEMGLKKYSNKRKFILGKARLLILPYITFSLFAYIFINAALHVDALANVLKSGEYSAVGIKDAFLQIITYKDHIDKHLWFVFSLFAVFLVNIILPKLMKSKPILLVLLALYVSEHFMPDLGILNYIANNLFFFSLARVMFSDINTEQEPNGQKQPFSFRPTSFEFLSLFAVFIAANCVYSYFYVTQMPQGVIINSVLQLLRCVSSVAGLLTVCSFSAFLSDTKISKPLKAVGLYSYDIYLMHAPFLVSGSMGILLAYAKLPIWLCSAAVLAIGIALPYLLSKFVIRKIPFLSLIILGRRSDKRANRSRNAAISD